MGSLTVVPFSGSNINDLPARLRALADSLEAGELGEVESLVWATIGPLGFCTHVGMLGKSHGRLHAIGALQAAMQRLLRQVA